MSKKLWILIPLLCIAAVILFTGVEALINSSVKPIPDLPETTLDAERMNEVLYYYSLGENAELPSGALSEETVNAAITPSLEYIDNRYDCSDFRVNTLVRLYLGYEYRLFDSTKSKIKNTLLDFKYWMDQGGSDSMCYWSENHQILFAVCEYLVGTKFPDEIFFVDGKTGSQHAEIAAKRINIWMEQRFKYGFTEWYSNNYYPEDIAAMSNFIEFSTDEDMVSRMKMIMDIIWFDLASQSSKYTTEDGRKYYIFLSANGRMYGDNKASDDTGNRLRPYIDYVMQPDSVDTWQKNTNSFFNCFRIAVDGGFYAVPEAIRAVFEDNTPQVVKSSQSLNVSELEDEKLIGLDDNQIMMQWNMESFTNKEVVANTLEYISKNKMFRNTFLNDFKMINLSLLKCTGLAGTVSKMLNPSTNGASIQRANVYTYKTDKYSMSTAMKYHPGDFGDQQHIFTANLSNDLSIFAGHPARVPERGSSPNYWVGNGRNPHSVQDKGINISIFDVPEKAGFMEPQIVQYTHAYFPKQYFDEIDESYLTKGAVFGRKGDNYVAMLTNGTLSYTDFDSSDLRQKENANRINKNLTDDYDLVLHSEGLHFWITELSSKGENSDVDFAAFKTRVLRTPPIFNLTAVEYSSQGRKLNLEYQGDFWVNDEKVTTEYERYESAYVKDGLVRRNPSEIVYSVDGKTLTLNYQQNVRVESQK